MSLCNTRRTIVIHFYWSKNFRPGRFLPGSKIYLIFLLFRLPTGRRSVPLQSVPPGPHTNVASKPFSHGFASNSTCSPSAKLRNPCICITVWDQKEKTDDNQNNFFKSHTGSQTKFKNNSLIMLCCMIKTTKWIRWVTRNICNRQIKKQPCGLSNHDGTY